MALFPKTSHALDLSEIRIRIASFLNNRDCVSCMRASKDWCKDFAGQVWDTIDFDKIESFSKIPPKVISKYGHLIRNVLKVAKENDLLVLQHSNITSLRNIEFVATNNRLSLSLFCDLIRYNSGILKSFAVSGCLDGIFSLTKQRAYGVYLPLDVFKPEASLTSLSLEGVCITRSAFSFILKSSPSLRALSLWSTMILAHNPSQELFRHEGITRLKASSIQVLNFNDDMPPSSSLLVHIPSLEIWELVRSIEVDLSWTMTELRQELSINCSNLKGVIFADNYYDYVSELLDNVFRRLECCTFPYYSLGSNVLLSLLAHQASLTTVVMTAPYRIGLEDDDAIRSSKKLIGLILRSCRRLKALSVKGHVMDVDYLEDQEIVCARLQEFQVRFQGLDDTAAVNNCLVRLANMKTLSSSLKVTDEPNKGDTSVELRICHQLMRFKKLKTVWLGTQDYYLPSQ
ncbi:hypothetical protein BGZ47_011013 [Haplosporangium gracile]|nr:hypothetical protein BGZ47_011013 [Haplosporangium gracile]